jgi:branched-chain amino acid transport system permease protein
VLGAALVVVGRDLLQDWLPSRRGSQGNFETVAFGMLLVAVLQAAPDGLWPRAARLRERILGPVRGTRRIHAAAAVPSPRRLPARGTKVLEVAALHKNFGGLAAVQGLDFSVHAGEIVGLIGPNGAGKSTTFNLLSGVAEASGGHVAFLGRSILGLPARAIAARGLARSFQHVKLVAGMSVIENVAIGAHLRGNAGAVAALLRLDRREEAMIFASAASALDRTGLAALAQRPATLLSLGQQRIVEIARALCLDPVLLLLDEPAAGLRHAEKARLATLLRQLRADGVAILLVEHDMEFVMTLADRLVVMDFGTRLAEGPPEAVRRDPAVIEAYLGSVA